MVSVRRQTQESRMFTSGANGHSSNALTMRAQSLRVSSLGDREQSTLRS